ncbi:isocitrate lyase/PEP mutase family protein [Streptantibioticus ferralitis]|uniref:Isocitrate lyase/phosphoenolpyruvate mutase family protein n=1 Tax=Streptantibioticus ferralitis TaxID=236510 RepID=A0ABT5YVG8_9ACTN|nr:isocitrate lyase/phosphoenolpyruvate mutase family protein [Streptantibioticus ferralitis]MDF2255392.1 isocitrate lyase/phosphoenolpyruvate mutase family protein [Streptantibioticus ferralitis]
MNATDPTSDQFARFRRLHHADRPLLLPNAWDHSSAAALADRGFAAIGTTSLGVAAAAGLPDGTGAARAQTMALARALTRLPALITVDVEGGFSEDPAQVAALAAELARAGVAGVNIEDGRPGGRLVPAGHQCEVIAAVKERAPGLFVNARTDTYWLADAPTGQTLPRAEAYRRAGADGLFVPGLTDAHTIAGLVRDLDAPLNVLYAPGRLTFQRLAELGVGRVSCGSLLFRAALHSAVQLACAIADPDAADPGLPSYDEAQALSSGVRRPAPN